MLSGHCFQHLCQPLFCSCSFHFRLHLALSIGKRADRKSPVLLSEKDLRRLRKDPCLLCRGRVTCNHSPWSSLQCVVVWQTWGSQSHFSGSGSEGEPAGRDHQIREKTGGVTTEAEYAQQWFAMCAATFIQQCFKSFLSYSLGRAPWRAKREVVGHHTGGLLSDLVLRQLVIFFLTWSFSNFYTAVILCSRTWAEKRFLKMSQESFLCLWPKK